MTCFAAFRGQRERLTTHVQSYFITKPFLQFHSTIVSAGLAWQTTWNNQGEIEAGNAKIHRPYLSSLLAVKNKI